MSHFRKRRSAYYGRNQSYSRSYNAENAESNGRLPKTRAARLIGVSVQLFNAAIEHGVINTNEWHHVGKFATRVDYWDTETIDCFEFWEFVFQKIHRKNILKNYSHTFPMLTYSLNYLRKSVNLYS